MRFKIEIFFALLFGGLALIGLILPALGYIFLALSVIVFADIIASEKGYEIKMAYPLRLQHKQVKNDTRHHIVTPEFSVKLENISIRGTVYLDSPIDEQPTIQWLIADISFRTNQPIQIASIHVEIDSIDPRDIMEPDLDLVQGFSLPHILERSETNRFQFKISPGKEKGESLLLKVLAGGYWYTDGPYTLRKESS